MRFVSLVTTMTVLHDSGQHTMNHSLCLPPVRVHTFQANALQLIFLIRCIYWGCCML